MDGKWKCWEIILKLSNMCKIKEDINLDDLVRSRFEIMRSTSYSAIF